MIFWLWLFILSGSGIIILLAAKALQEKYRFNFPMYDKRQHFESHLSGIAQKTVRFMETVNADMFIGMAHAFIERMGHLFSRHRDAVREKAAAMSRRMITSTNDPDKKPSDFLNDVKSFKDRFRDK